MNSFKNKLLQDRVLACARLSQIKEFAPSKRELALNTFLGTLSNIPCPLIGAVTTAAEIGKELKEYKDFSSNWVSFILKAREK